MNLIDPCLFLRHNNDAGFDLISTFLENALRGKDIQPFVRKEILEYQSDFKINLIFSYLYLIMVPLFGSVVIRLQYQNMNLIQNHPFGLFTCLFYFAMSAFSHYSAF